MTHSMSNLRVPSLASITGSPMVHNTEALASSSSSMNNVDMSDRILVPEPEVDVEIVMEQQNAIGQMGGSASDEESKENLRAKLRNTLSKKQSLPGTFWAGCGAVSSSCLVRWFEGLIAPLFFLQMLGFGRGREGSRRN